MATGAEYIPGSGRIELQRRIGEYASRGIAVVLYGTPNVELQSPVEARTPGRPAHNAETGAVATRLCAVYTAPAGDLDSPVWHASVLPVTEPYTAGRRVDTSDEGDPYFTFMINPEAIAKVETATPVGAVFLLNGEVFSPSPYNGLDYIHEGPVPLLHPIPTLVTYHDLSFDLRTLSPVRVVR